MPLSAGNKLGPYEIVAPIGAGGMGEVYRARDTKLKRDVAIKVLPEAFARDPERMARFQREAEVLASLNHPNIAAIYGVEERALVMELVEGASPKGPLPFDEAWKIASQIVAALEYAHERGIMHRDLKPANIMVTPEGGVKLLDFGLAKAFTNQREPSASPENSPTLTLGATEVGVILGTAPYMAPEQARGKAVDKRADIWSFGVVLYELLTGERLFTGEDAAETLAAVIHKQPDLAKAPQSARRLLEECLQKDPKQRLRDIGDAKRQLGAETPLEPVVATVPSRSRLSQIVWMAMAAAFAAVATVLGVLYFRQSPGQSPIVKMSVLPPQDVTLSTMSVPAVSPDGRQIAFAANQDGKASLWVRDLGSLDARLLPGTEGADLPFWSPDSRSLGFFAEGKLKRTDAAGGAVRTLCDASSVARGGTWGQDDTILFSPGLLTALSRIPAAGGTPVAITTVSPDEPAHRYPWFLPDGRHYLYTAYGRTRDKHTLYVGELDSKNRRALMPMTSNVIYVSPGYLLFLRDQNLMAQPFDTGKLKTTGEAVPIADKVTYVSVDLRAAFSASKNGVLAYSSLVTGSDQQLTWFDRSGKSGGWIEALTGGVDPVISSDGNFIAFRSNDRQTGLSNIWVHDVARGINSRFTLNGKTNFHPRWSPDQGHVTFYATDGGTGVLYQKAINGSGQDELLDSENGYPTDWSSDGRYIIQQMVGTYDIWVVPLFGDKKPFFYLRGANEQSAKLSPSGKWLAYVSAESNQKEIYVQSFPKLGGGKWQISTNGGTFPVWSRDGKELFYLTPDGKMMAVTVESGEKFVASTPKLLFDTHNPSINFDVGKDGRFLIPMQMKRDGPTPIAVVMNWQAALKK